MFFLFT